MSINDNRFDSRINPVANTRINPVNNTTNVTNYINVVTPGVYAKILSVLGLPEDASELDLLEALILLKNDSRRNSYTFKDSLLGSGSIRGGVDSHTVN